MIKSFWKVKKTKKAISTGRRKLEEMGHNDLIKILDREFSFFIRVSEVVKTGSPWIKCYTCDGRHHWKDLDNGHYMGREMMGTRFDTRNCRPQCTTCNCYKEGNKAVFTARLITEGMDVKKVMEYAEFWGRCHHANESLLAQIEEYRRINKILKDQIKGME